MEVYNPTKGEILYKCNVTIKSRHFVKIEAFDKYFIQLHNKKPWSKRNTSTLLFSKYYIGKA